MLLLPDIASVSWHWPVADYGDRLPVGKPRWRVAVMHAPIELLLNDVYVDIDGWPNPEPTVSKKPTVPAEFDPIAAYAAYGGIPVV